MPALFSGGLQALGAAAAAAIAWRFLSFLHLYFVHASTLPRYLHPRNGGVRPWALVTGASDGIGLATSRRLLAAGFSVVLHGRNAEKLERCRKQLLEGAPKDVDVSYVAASAVDAIKSAEIVVEFVRKEIEGKGARLTVLVNNVGGTAMFGSSIITINELDKSTTEQQISLNAVFPAFLTQGLMPILAANKPSLIINVGSYAGVHAYPYLTMYSASKAFNHAFSRALSKEMHATGQDIEVLGIVVAQVSSQGNQDAPSFMVLSSDEMARDILARVGCGKELVVGSWRHCVTGDSMKFLMTDSMQRRVMTTIMTKRRSEEQALLAKNN